MEEVDDELDFSADPLPFPLLTSHVEREKSEETDVDMEDYLGLPAADQHLTIPGEKILCRDKAAINTHYWPAIIQAYIPPAKRGVDGRYLVKYLDGLERKVPRGWFYEMMQDEFGTCKVQFEQSHIVKHR